MGDEILSGGRAFFAARRPCLQIVSQPPSPRPALAERSSQREGGDQGYFMQGATAPGTPALDRLRRWLSLPYTCPCGGVLSLSPAYTAFSFFSAPLPRRGRISPRPALAERSSQREGGDQGYFMQGASPLASPGMNPGGTGSSGASGTRRGLSGGRRMTMP